ncbi:hypothetical protein QZH41_001767 [Actinostola sp. cb2023]|nr:hypothetical protein QZH41_001767 [Actinostola sp. cb2023]
MDSEVYNPNIREMTKIATMECPTENNSSALKATGQTINAKHEQYSGGEGLKVCTGLMDNGKIPYEGLEMAEGGVPFLKKEGSKTTPRSTKASLPSPPLSSAMEALNKKVEQLMAENKLLEKAIFGPPTEPAKARKPAKQKSVEGARAMNLEDLRAMGGVQRMAERDMERYGAMDQSSDSDSNTERDDSDGSADKDCRRKGKHSKAKLKSGKTAKITSRVVNPQVWPHSELSLSYVTKNVRYNELTMEEFVAGYSSILSRPRISPVEKEARITHLTRCQQEKDHYGMIKGDYRTIGDSTQDAYITYHDFKALSGSFHDDDTTEQKIRNLRDLSRDDFIAVQDFRTLQDFIHHDNDGSTDREWCISRDSPRDATGFCDLVALHEAVLKYGIPDYKGARIPVSSNLQIAVWRKLLQDFPDVKLCDMLEFGFPVNYNYAANGFPVSDRRNHKGALAFDSDVSSYLLDELINGTVAGPFPSCPFRSGRFMTSPLNTVPKGDSDERRIILDLSWPLDTSVNAGIPIDTYDDEPCLLSYPLVDTIAERILSVGPACLIYKRDLRKAYRQVPVDPLDYPLLGFEWHDNFYFDVVLAMGQRSAALSCQRVTSGISFICSANGYSLINYLDDFIGVEAESKAWEAFHYLGALLADLGLKESFSKACEPVTKVAPYRLSKRVRKTMSMRNNGT